MCCRSACSFSRDSKIFDSLLGYCLLGELDSSFDRSLISTDFGALISLAMSVLFILAKSLSMLEVSIPERHVLFQCLSP